MRRMWTLSMLLLPGMASAQVTVDQLTAVLTPRHAGAPCEALMALGDANQVTETLITVADTVTMPPWVGTRAAHCVSERIVADAKAEDAAQRWLASPTTAGFGLIVLGQLDSLPEPKRAPLVRIARERITEDAPFALHAERLLRQR